MPHPLQGEHADSGAVSYPRAARWEPATVLTELARATGIRLVDEGWCQGGQIGACYVRWPDGHRSVLTAGPPGGPAARRAADLAAVARAAGVPAPRYELVADLPSVTAVVQELLPGTVPVTVTRRTVASMVEVMGRCRGLLADRTELPAPSLFLRADGPGFCGEVTGVVDWDGAARSNGALDLMTVRFDLARRAPGLGDWVGRLLREAVPETVRLACWAHMSLRLVDWAIREQTADDVSAWLRVATEVRTEL